MTPEIEAFQRGLRQPSHEPGNVSTFYIFDLNSAPLSSDVSGHSSACGDRGQLKEWEHVQLT